MPADYETVFVSIALARALVSAEQVEECLSEAQNADGPAPLPVLLRQRGFLSADQFRSISADVFKERDSAALRDEVFGFLCLAGKLVLGYQIREYLDSQTSQSLKDFLLSRRAITIEQALDVERAAARTLAACPGCGARYPLPSPGTARLCCPTCGTVFPPPDVAMTAGNIRHRLDQYDIEGEIGKGAMGLVFRARHRETGVLVALKTLLADAVGDPGLLERFRREANLAANLRHPAIVRVVDIGETQDTVFIAMEYVEGRTLEAQIAEGNLSPHDAALVAVEAARALDHAHRRGVIHRDIKPGNLMIDTQGRVRVCDFGLAKQRDVATITASGSIVGTPMYMSPEQANPGATVDHRTDIYSLGATLYEAVTGRPPFVGKDVHSIIRKVKTSDPPLLSRIVSGVHKDIQSIVLKAMERNPARRYARAQEMAEDLDRFLAGLPVHAPSPTRLGLFLRSLSRRREALLVGFLGVAFLVALAAIFLKESRIASLPQEDALASEAFAAFRMGDYPLAERLYTVIIDTRPSADAWLYRGLALRAQSRTDMALLDFARARLFDPTSARPILEQGKTLLAAARFEQAWAAFTLYNALRPQGVEGWVGTGRAAMALQRQDQAREAYGRALALDPGHRAALRGAFRADLDRSRFLKAAKTLADMNAAGVPFSERAFHEGRWMLATGQARKARQLFLTAERTGFEGEDFPRLSLASRLGLGIVKRLSMPLLADVSKDLDKHRAPDALIRVDQAIHMGPDRILAAELLFLRCRILIALGRTPDASAALSQAWETHPKRWSLGLAALRALGEAGAPKDGIARMAQTMARGAPKEVGRKLGEISLDPKGNHDG